jgi:NADPH:quinone reductase-like Zn-dependent oxidoreductase
MACAGRDPYDRRRDKESEGGTGMRAWQIQTTEGIDGLKLADLELPDPGPGELRVRLRASSINYRDLSVVSNPAARNLALPRIPKSDGAGEVLTVGPGVTGFASGDRVAGCFFADWVDGPCSAAAMATARAGSPNHRCLPAQTAKPAPATQPMRLWAIHSTRRRVYRQRLRHAHCAA